MFRFHSIFISISAASEDPNLVDLGVVPRKPHARDDWLRLERGAICMASGLPICMAYGIMNLNMLIVSICY